MKTLTYKLKSCPGIELELPKKTIKISKRFIKVAKDVKSYEEFSEVFKDDSYFNEMDNFERGNLIGILETLGRARTEASKIRCKEEIYFDIAKYELKRMGQKLDSLDCIIEANYRNLYKRGTKK